VLHPDLSGRVASLEGSETFADVNGSPQLTIHALDSGVHPPDLGNHLVPDGVDLHQMFAIKSIHKMHIHSYVKNSDRIVIGMTDT